MASAQRELLYKRYNLDLSSVNRALTSFNHLLDSDRQRKQTVCNKLIRELGGKLVDDPVDAEVFAKALIEQVILKGEDFDIDTASQAATAKVAKIRQTMPELYIVQVEEVVDDTGPLRSKKVKRVSTRGEANDKKSAAFAIYNMHKEKSSGDIARLIAAELKITYANASYYVTRVFKK